jgi:hypothetical protein
MREVVEGAVVDQQVESAGNACGRGDVIDDEGRGDVSGRRFGSCAADR